MKNKQILVTTLLVTLFSASCLAGLRPTSHSMNFVTATWKGDLTTNSDDKSVHRDGTYWNAPMILFPGKTYTFTWTKHNDQEDRYELQYALINNDISGLNLDNNDQLEDLQDKNIWKTFATITNPEGNGTESAAPRNWTGKIPCAGLGDGLYLGPNFSTKAIYLRIVRFDRVNGNGNSFPRPSKPVKIAHGGRPNPTAPAVYLGCGQQDPWPYDLPETLSLSYRVNQKWETFEVKEYRTITWFTKIDMASKFLVNRSSVTEADKSGYGTSYNPQGADRTAPVHFAIYSDLDCRELVAVQTPQIVTLIKIPEVQINGIVPATYYLSDDRNLDPSLKCTLPLVNFFPLPNPVNVANPLVEMLSNNNPLGFTINGSTRVDLPSIGNEKNYIDVSFDYDANWQVKNPLNMTQFIDVNGTEGHTSESSYPLSPFDTELKVCVDNLLYQLNNNSPIQKTYRLTTKLFAKATAVAGVYNNASDFYSTDQQTCELYSSEITVKMIDNNNPVCETSIVDGDKTINDNDVPITDPTGNLIISESYSWEPQVAIVSGENTLYPIVNFNYIKNQPNARVKFVLTRNTTISPANQAMSPQVLVTKKCIEVMAQQLWNPNGDPVSVIGNSEDGTVAVKVNPSEGTDFEIVLAPNPTIPGVKQVSAKVQELLGSLDAPNGIKIQVINLNNQIELEQFVTPNNWAILNLMHTQAGYKYVRFYIDTILISQKLIDVK
jgi:hypothetical protein